MKKHYEEIDRLRGIAIGMVILYHAIIVYPIDLHVIAWCKMLHDFLWYVEMPLFFVVSGFCFSYKGSLKSYLKKKTMRILVPHIVFGVLDILPRIIPNPLVNKKADAASAVRELILYGGSDWFLRVLFVLFAVFPLLDWCLKKSKLWKAAALLFVLILYGTSDWITNVMQLRMAATYLCFFTAGYLIQTLDYESKVKPLLSNRYSGIISFFIMLLFFVLQQCGFENKWYTLVGTMAGCVFFYSLCVWSKGFFGKFLQICGKYSLQIYLLGGYALVLSRTLLVSFLGIRQPVIIILLNFGIDMAITIFISRWILKRWRITRILSGLN